METKDARRILIVDDSEDMRNILQYQVRSYTDAEPCLAANAAEAMCFVELAREEGKPFDLILMDIRMPEISGVEAARQLRAKGFTGVIAACTAATSGSGRRESMDAGIDAYFDKRVLKKDTILALLAMAKK